MGGALLALLVTAGAPCSAETLVGTVVAIQDGDTLTLLDAAKVQHRIRLSGIDAPEKKQPFGLRSKQALSDLAYRRRAAVEWRKHDRYGRVLGKLLVDGRDVNLQQVASGLAWHYVEYARDQSPADRARYAEAEAGARVRRIGLFRDPLPLAPWDYRRAKRAAGVHADDPA